MISYQLLPRFIPGAEGNLFVLLLQPEKVNSSAIIVPPFAEEMNKCRRQMMRTARDLAAQGVAVMILDLYGTGDSEGEFADAQWSTWVEDVVLAMRWMGAEVGGVENLIATRLGCALAVDALRDSQHRLSRSVFWQPVASGRQFMTQFLRLQVAAGMLDATSQTTVEALRQQLLDDQVLEVAGYALTPSMWAAVEAIELAEKMNTLLGETLVLEVGRSSSDSLSPAGQKLLAAAMQNDVSVSGERIAGEPFWTATEIVTNDALRAQTVAFLLART